MNASDKAAPPDVQGPNDALELAKKVFEVVDIFRFTLGLVLVLVLWAVAYLVLFVIGALDWTGVYPAMIWIVIALFVVAAIRLPAVFEGLRALKNWNKKYVSYAFLNVFEFAPRSTSNVSQEVVGKLRRIYPAIDKQIKRSPEAIQFNYAIEGRKGRTYAFDAVIELKDSYIVVEVKKGGTEVDLAEVRSFMQKLSQVMKDTDMDILQGIVVSEGGFTEEAIDFVSSKENWITMARPGRLSPTLLKVTDSGYQVEWLQAMMQSQTS